MSAKAPQPPPDDHVPGQGPYSPPPPRPRSPLLWEPRAQPLPRMVQRPTSQEIPSQGVDGGCLAAIALIAGFWGAVLSAAIAWSQGGAG